MMRERLESLVLVMAVGAGVAVGAKRAGVPYNVALVVVGLFLVFADVLPRTPLDPEIVLVAFLPILVFEAALFADADALAREARPILTLALPGVAVSLLGTAIVAKFALNLPFAAALLLGALLAITDTVSVLLAFRSVRVPPRLAAIMEGESLFNDGTALVLVSLTTAVLATGAFDTAATIRTLLAAIGGGLVIGAAFAAVGSMVLRRTPDGSSSVPRSLRLAPWSCAARPITSPRSSHRACSCSRPRSSPSACTRRPSSPSSSWAWVPVVRHATLSSRRA